MAAIVPIICGTSQVLKKEGSKIKVGKEILTEEETRQPETRKSRE